MSDKDEYLVIRAGRQKFGLYAKDIYNVYNYIPQIRPLPQQSEIYVGITNINEQLVSVIDFKKRLSMRSFSSALDEKKMVVFHTSVGEYLAILIDEIMGFMNIQQDRMIKHDLKNKKMNMNLLLPLVAKTDDESLIMIIDPTYMEKTQFIEEDSGGLELF